jgi:hypothetical protein
MPIVVTLSAELRVPVPTVGGIQLVSIQEVHVQPEWYTHCDGTQLKLTDSNFGQEQYQSTDYYVWSTGSDEQLLFIFPTKVSLTTITLHYYNDSVHGLPRLSFYAVPDDFDVWDLPTTNNPQVSVASVPPGIEPAGHRSVSINVNRSTQGKY